METITLFLVLGLILTLAVAVRFWDIKNGACRRLKEQLNQAEILKKLNISRLHEQKICYQNKVKDSKNKIKVAKKQINDILNNI